MWLILPLVLINLAIWFAHSRIWTSNEVEPSPDVPEEPSWTIIDNSPGFTTTTTVSRARRDRCANRHNVSISIIVIHVVRALVNLVTLITLVPTGTINANANTTNINTTGPLPPQPPPKMALAHPLRSTIPHLLHKPLHPLRPLLLQQTRPQTRPALHLAPIHESATNEAEESRWAQGGEGGNQGEGGAFGDDDGEGRVGGFGDGFAALAHAVAF
ncbi:hypothetical protein CLIM01_13328 [Colletotrichum limetticola]|uniref:Integral membrane protein n=1 Tax=Colletotrichum limetticola TaxID=1209924 RepID=A0ABQ9PCP1_9PEZI|nr:hypothetical protein CLIM01_13328 [Colletotrichum limetticola]